MRLFLTFSLIVFLAGIVSAVTHDTIRLTVTPLFNLSVNISSTTQDFGAINVASSKTIDIGTIINDGNVSTYWEKQCSNSADSGGADKWTVDPNGSPAVDYFSLLLITTGTALVPTYVGGTAADSIMDLGTEESYAYVTEGSYSTLTDGAGSTRSPFHLPYTTTRELWCSIMMPTSVIDSAQQTITLSIQAATSP